MLGFRAKKYRAEGYRVSGFRVYGSRAYRIRVLKTTEDNFCWALSLFLVMT